MNSGLVMYEEEFRLIAGICDRLTRDANAKVVFLVDKNGQLLASSGRAQTPATTAPIPGLRAGLARDANAKVVFLVDKNGQLIASSGQAQNLDTTSLASLTAGNVAAMGGLAKLIGG